MKLRNIDLCGRRNHRLEEHGKDKAQNGQKGLHAVSSKFPARLFTGCDAFRSRAQYKELVLPKRCRSGGFETFYPADFRSAGLSISRRANFDTAIGLANPRYDTFRGLPYFCCSSDSLQIHRRSLTKVPRLAVRLVEGLLLS